MTNEIEEKDIVFSTRITISSHPLYKYIKNSYINIREDSVDGVCFDPETFNCHAFSLTYDSIDHVYEFAHEEGIITVADKKHNLYYIQAIEKEQQTVDLINEKLKKLGC